MIPIYRRQLAFVRAMGIDVFVLPGPPVNTPTGEAFMGEIDGEPTRHINIAGSVNSPLWLFVLMHELAHHANGHVERWSSEPAWIKEIAADHFALRVIKDMQPYAARLCERASKQHIRPLLQRMIDDEIWHHVDLETARWAGCALPAYAIHILKPPPRHAAADDDIIF